jgi:hypothetical protein
MVTDTPTAQSDAVLDRPRRQGIRYRHVFAAATMLLAAAACSGDEEETAGIEPIEPIEPILASEIIITADPSGTTATLTVDTNIPVACAVIYGTDSTFGSIAVDNDMQGGAHQDHGPLLTGLTPDTDYDYVLQGSDAAGTVYRSDTLTFRTPPADESGIGVNIAPTGIVTGASSEFSDTFAADNAIDGNLATEWSTAGDGDDAWIEIDLGEVHDIIGVAFRTREMTDGTAITNTFDVTIDGERRGPFPTGADPVMLEEPVTGRTLRIDAEQTTGGNTGATEIEIYRPE